jgi:hypothetical protein
MKIKKYKEIYHEHIKEKEVRITILISDKVSNKEN